MIQLLLPLLTALAGGVTGLMESRSANSVELKKLDNDRERDAILAAQGNIKDYYESNTRSDDPKLNKIQLWGFTYESYKYVQIPTRLYQFRVMWLLTLAYCFVVGCSVLGADIPIWSFPASPDAYKWFSLLGFSLTEGTKTSVYQLTLGGILLPLLSPFFFAFTRYVTGPSQSKF
jgi:hypothetical protein